MNSQTLNNSLIYQRPIRDWVEDAERTRRPNPATPLAPTCRGCHDSHLPIKFAVLCRFRAPRSGGCGYRAIRGPYHPLHRHVPKIRLGGQGPFVHKRGSTNRNALKE